MKRFLSVCAAASAIALGSSFAHAVVTSRWVVDDYQAFAEGEGDGALITSLGEVRPGWTTAHTDLEFSGSWAAVRGSDGVLYLGTDDDGTIYAGRDGKVKKLAKVDGAVAVVSLAVDGSTLYAGTMPGGAVWKVDTRSGKARKLASLPEVETVWALVMGQNGRLYAGTGPDGKVFELWPKSGKARVVLETGDKRVMSAAVATDGAIWVGTSDKALVFRYDPKRDESRAMADFAGNEITAMAAFAGGMVVAANDLEAPPTSGVKTASAVAKALKEKKAGEKPDMPDEGTVPGADDRSPTGSEPRRKGARKGKGALFAVRGDGQLRQLHALTATYFTSIAVTDRGQIFAGAGDEGRIYLVDPDDDSVSMAFDVPQRFIAQVVYDPKGGLAFVTGDSAGLYRATGASAKATYTSDVFDARAPSHFGKIAWRGTGRIKVETRSGNTAEPEGTGTSTGGWSAWAVPARISAGAGSRRSGVIASPPGRYIQYRVTFGGDAHALLRQTTVYYLPQNKAPEIESVDLERKGADSSKLVTMKEGAADPRSPVLKVSWDVKNDDGDDLVYRLAVRREGEVRWRQIATAEAPLSDTDYEWNTETFPDGYYRLRVTATDSRSNAGARAQTFAKTTPLFLIDNHKPALRGLKVRGRAATLSAADGMSVISEMSYAIDDGHWHVGAPKDGIFDELSEILTVRLPADLAPGIHSLAIRVADEAGNIGATAVTFRTH
ncbi:MAG TPA: WD40 repeat domain-containing protein [Kofleriaceae bacterium]|nr:WD40 repeat domain-containing protein [Kofleriaceae bacterium]